MLASATSLPGAGIHQSRTADQTTHSVMSATSDSTAIMPSITAETQDSTSFAGTTDATSVLTTLTPSRTTANKTTSSANPFVDAKQSEAMVIAGEKEIGNGTSTKSLPSPTPALMNESRTSDQMALSTLSAANNSTTTPAVLSNYTTELVNSTTLPGIVNTAPVMTTIVPSPTTADNAISSSSPFSGAMLPNDTIIANQTFEQGVTNSTIIPATPLPTLQTLVAKEVESTLISKMARSLVKYQLRNPLEDLSAQTEFLEKVIEFYKVVSLVIGLSSFARSINASHPEIARKYEDKLKKITNEIKDAVKKESQGTHRFRRGFMEDMYKRVLQELYEFTKEPMSGDMLTFFKGFEAERELFTQHMSNPVGDIPKELKYLFDNMGTATRVIVAMNHYSLRIKDLLSKGLFEEVGKIALKVNVLYAVGKKLVKAGQWDSEQSLENPFKDLLAEFQSWKDVQIKALKTLSDTDPTTLQLNDLITFSLVYDSLRAGRVGDALGEGFCWADTIALGIAAQYLKVTDSLAMMAESILYGIGYGKYALELRLILQELAFWSQGEGLMVNQAISFGIKKGSVYYKKLIERFHKLASTMDKAIRSSTIESIDQFIEQFQKIYKATGSSELMQFMLAPNESHAFYVDIREIEGIFKLTISDIANGLHVATGKTIDALKESISQQMGSFLKSYNIPLESTGEAVPKSGYVRLREDMLNPLEDLQLFPDSALTIKDILSNPPEKLQAIDIANTQALIEKYLKTVSKKSNQNMFKADKQAEDPKPGTSDEMVTVNDPIIAQMREVLAALRTANSSALTRHLSQQIKDLNAHILKTIDSYSKQVANPEKPASSSADAEQAGQESIALTEEEAIKLSIDYDFMRLVNPAAKGLKMAQSQPGADPVPESTTQEGGKLSDGAKAGGGVASFAAAVGGALVAFRASCPGCLTQMLSDLAESVQDMQLGQELPEVAKTLTKKAVEETGKKVAEDGVEETGKKAVEDGTEEVGKKGLKEGGKAAVKKGLKEGGKEAAKKLLRCRRSGACDVVKDLKKLKDVVDDLEELAEAAKLVAELDGAEDAGDTAAAAIVVKKLGDWLGKVFGAIFGKSGKGHKGHKGKDSDNHMTVDQLVHAIHFMMITPAPATTSHGLTSGAATGKATARGTDSSDNSERTTKPTTRPKTTKATTPKTTEATTAETTTATTPGTTAATTGRTTAATTSETTDTTARSSGNRTDTTPATTTKINQLSITDAVLGNGTTTQPETTPSDTPTLAPDPDSSTSFHEPMTDPGNSSTRAVTNTEPATGSGETTTIITATDRNTTQDTTRTTARISTTDPTTLSSTAEPTSAVENSTMLAGTTSGPSTGDIEATTIITPADRNTTQGTAGTTARTSSANPATLSSTAEPTGRAENSTTSAGTTTVLATDDTETTIITPVDRNATQGTAETTARASTTNPGRLSSTAEPTARAENNTTPVGNTTEPAIGHTGTTTLTTPADRNVTQSTTTARTSTTNRLRSTVEPTGKAENSTTSAGTTTGRATDDTETTTIITPADRNTTQGSTRTTHRTSTTGPAGFTGTVEPTSRAKNSTTPVGNSTEPAADDTRATTFTTPADRNITRGSTTTRTSTTDPAGLSSTGEPTSRPKNSTTPAGTSTEPASDDAGTATFTTPADRKTTQGTTRTTAGTSTTEPASSTVELTDSPVNSTIATRPVVPLANWARQMTDRFDAEIGKAMNTTLESIDRLNAASAKRRSVQKRVLLGDALNTLNDRFDERFLKVFQQAHRASAGSSGKPVADDKLITLFQQMYVSVCEQRMRLFVDAGYIDTGNLSQEEILQLRSAALDEDGKVVLSPSHLIDVINDTLKTSGDYQPFDEFLNQLLGTLEDKSRPTRLAPPATDLINGNQLRQGRQQLGEVLEGEKERFIDDVQALHLRDNGHFSDEVSPGGQDVLFLPSTFLDVIKDPDAYRGAFDRDDTRYRQLDFDPLQDGVNMMGAGKTPKPVVTKGTTVGQPLSTDSSTTESRQLKDYPSLPDPVMPLSDRAREVTDRFDSEISKDIDRTRENILHLSAGSARQRSIQKRVLLGDGLNTLNDRFESRFLAVFEQAHRASSSTAAAFTDGELTAIFEQMYTLLCEERIQLFIDVGYIDAGNLSQKEILQLKSGAYDKDGNVVLSPQHLSKVIGDTLREYGEHNPFNEFLSHLLTRLGQRPGLTEPARESGTLHNHNNPGTNGPMLADILKREKNLFIADIQKIYLRDSGHFEDEISLDGASQDVLFLPSTFLDVIKDPDAYRAIFDGTQRYDGHAKGSGIARSRKRRDIDQSPAPASSSAARPGGVIGNIGRYLGGLLPATASVPDKSPVIDSESQGHDSPASAFTRSSQLHGVGNLALATLLASRFNNRQIETGQRTIAENQDLLSQSPGMRLLSNSSAIAGQLGAEVRAFVDHLNDSDQTIAADWSLNDLVNMAIMQTTTKKSTNVAEAFLDEVLKSPQIGVEHERPENIFEADGRVRGKADSDQSLFHDPETGKTDTTGPVMGLARAMLQAMARRRLAGQNYDLTDSQRREIIQQVNVLADRQKTSGVAGLAKFIGLGGGKASPAGIADILDERLTDKSTILTQQHDPLINLLDRGDYVGGKKLFVQLSPDQLLEKVETLASEPDHLGIDYSAGLLADLRAEMFTAFSDSGEKPNLNRSFSRQRAWELFTNLYDSKIAAQKEAFDRVKTQAMIHRHGIRDISEASHLSQLLVQLQPVRASASDYVGALQQNTSPGVVKLHQFDLKRTAGMIKHYLVLKDFVDKHFAQTFGSAVTEPKLREELVSHVARTSLDALKGNIHSGSWEVIAGQNLKDEHDEFVALGGNDVDVLY